VIASSAARRLPYSAVCGTDVAWEKGGASAER